MSVGAVSRALANDPKMNAQTRARIRQIAQDIGYTPDRAAQGLRTGRTNVIRLVLPPHDEIFGFGTSLIRGISSVLCETPYQLVVTPDLIEGGSETIVQDIVRNKLADGVIFSRTSPNDMRVRFLLEADFPFISHGRTELASPHPFVDFDNFEFARLGARMLIGKGADRLGILLPSPHLTFRNHLLHGFMSTVRETGVAHEIVEQATLDGSPEELQAAITDLLQSPNRPNGLILPGEVSGLAALAAVQDLGLVPGAHVHLLIKQTTGLFGLVRPKTDSLFEDLPAAGRKLAALLLRRIQGDPVSGLHYVQPVQPPATGSVLSF